MNEQDYKTVEAMEKYGGSFVKQLAKLCHHADAFNLDLIKITWARYWKEYTEMANKETEHE
jgi:hypothetical protein